MMTQNEMQELALVVKTADGRPWVQKCYVCKNLVNFIKDFSVSYVRVAPYVRHKKCRPPPAR